MEFRAGPVHGMVVVGNVEDLEAEPIGFKAQIHHLPEVAGVDIGEDISQTELGVLEIGGKVRRVLVRLDHIVDPQAVDIGPASAPILTEAIIDESIEEASAFHGRRKTLTRRYATLAALTEIAGLTPESISLVHISSEARERFSGGLEPVDRKLLLKGVVTGERTSLETTLTVYVARLNQSPLFGSVEVDSLRLVDGEEGLHLLFALKANDERAGEEIVAER